MPDKYRALRIVLFASLLPTAFGSKTDSARFAPIEQTLETIRGCMVQSPAPWPDTWKKEYIDTIRSVLQSHQDDAHCAERLEILRKGYSTYWDSFTKTAERPLFEVHRVRIRWYVENLMETEFPTEQERQRLRDQFTEIWDHAASSLLVQFPFLDPSTVLKAKMDDLQQCYRKIETPLMPVKRFPSAKPYSHEVTF